MANIQVFEYQNNKVRTALPKGIDVEYKEVTDDAN